jgi:hypothetical protein
MSRCFITIFLIRSNDFGGFRFAKWPGFQCCPLFNDRSSALHLAILGKIGPGGGGWSRVRNRFPAAAHDGEAGFASDCKRKECFI